MRQPETAQTGCRRRSRRRTRLHHIGMGPRFRWCATQTNSTWGPDLLLLVRDERRFDPGFVVGAQVKAGPTAFDEPRRDESVEITGWWFRDDREHFDYWLRPCGAPPCRPARPDNGNVVPGPHHTEVGGTCGQERQGARSTREHRATGITGSPAGRSRPRCVSPSVWEGSAWSGATTVAPADLLRHSLLVPRLVARTRTQASTARSNAEQVTALLAEARLTEVELYSHRYPGQVPRARHGGDSPDWMWRFPPRSSCG